MPYFRDDVLKDGEYLAHIMLKGEKVYSTQSQYQRIDIFDSKLFGRLLALDYDIQLTEYDEHIYHSFMVQGAVTSCQNKERSVLVIGGADGGIARELLKFKTVNRIHVVELDETVYNVCKEYLPKISDGAFENPRVHVTFGDGLKYMEQTQKKYDIIIFDMNEYNGIGYKQTYPLAKRCLAEGGIISSHHGTGTEILDPKYLEDLHDYLRNEFSWNYYRDIHVPSWCFGKVHMSLSKV